MCQMYSWSWSEFWFLAITQLRINLLSFISHVTASPKCIMGFGCMGMKAGYLLEEHHGTRDVMSQQTLSALHLFIYGADAKIMTAFSFIPCLLLQSFVFSFSEPQQTPTALFLLSARRVLDSPSPGKTIIKLLLMWVWCYCSVWRKKNEKKEKKKICERTFKRRKYFNYLLRSCSCGSLALPLNNEKMNLGQDGSPWCSAFPGETWQTSYLLLEE